MTMGRNITVRVPDSLVDRVDGLMNVMATKGSGDRSRVIRQFLAKESSVWLTSPYFCSQAHHFIYVSATGNIAYRGVQHLDINYERYKLPSLFRMSEERKNHYRGLFPEEGDEAEMHRKVWMLNHFAAWEGSSISGTPLDACTDRVGQIDKFADLVVDVPQDTLVTRETIIALKDGAARREGDDIADDRFDIPMDLPSLNVDIQIMVDLDLYSQDTKLRRASAIGRQYRNAEGALLREPHAGNRDNPVAWRRDRCPATKYSSKEYQRNIAAVEQSFTEMKERISSLVDGAGADARGNSVAYDESARSLLTDFEMPKRYIFGWLSWPMPFQGWKICLTWNRAPKVIELEPSVGVEPVR
jgi:hypothetical protein